MSVQQYSIVANDWLNLEAIINDLTQRVVGQELHPTSDPTFGSGTITGNLNVGGDLDITGNLDIDGTLTLDGLTALRLVATDAGKALESVDLVAWVAGTADEITVADDADGTITIGIADPLIVSKGGTGRATSTTAYGLVAAGTTATGVHQTLAAGLTTQVLVGGGTGAIPTWGTNIPTAVTIGSAYVYRVGGTDVAVTDGGTGTGSLTDHGILLGSGTSAVTPLGVANNGQLPIGSNGADPVLATITGTANQITSTPGAGSITLSTPQNIHAAAANFTVAGATVTGASVVGLNSAVFQPATNSTTFFQVKDQAGAVVGNFDTTNKTFGIGEPSEDADLHVQGDVEILDDSVLGSESLNEIDFNSHVKWDVTNDFTDDVGNKAEWTWSANQTSTLTQIEANLRLGINADMWYKFVYTVSVTTAPDGDMAATITTGVALAAEALEITAGTHALRFKTAADPDDFVISIISGTDTEGQLSFDDLSLKPIVGGNLLVRGSVSGNTLEIKTPTGSTTGGGGLSRPTVYPAGNWAGIIDQRDNSSTSHGLFVASRWHTDNSILVDFGYVTALTGVYVSYFKITTGGTFTVGADINLRGLFTPTTNDFYPYVNIGSNRQGYPAYLWNAWDNSANDGIIIGTKRSTDGRLLSVRNDLGFTDGLATDTGTSVFEITTVGDIGIGGEIAPETLTEWTHTAPYLTLHNSTHEDADGGRELRLIFKGEQSGGEETALFQFEASHDGSSDDQLGRGVWSVNTGTGLVEGLKLDSSLDVEATKAKITAIGGYAIKLTNNTTVNSVEGQLVEADDTDENSYKVADSDSIDPIGVVYNAGVADGSEVWIVVAGIAEVLLDAGGCIHHDRLISSNTAGSADVSNTPAVGVHFQEIGHALETVVGAGLAKAVIHFL